MANNFVGHKKLLATAAKEMREKTAGKLATEKKFSRIYKVYCI